MKEWLEFIDKVDEDYLVGLTNKGLVKRAAKDLEKVTIILEESLGPPAILHMEEVTCRIASPVGESTCTCPSRSICRHIVIGVLYLKARIPKEPLEKLEKEEKTETGFLDWKKEQFPELCSFPLEKLKKVIGEKKLQHFLKRRSLQEGPSIEVTSIVTVTFLEDGTVVKLLEPLEHSSCTCRKKTLCVHKAEAILTCQLALNLLSQEELEQPEACSESVDFTEQKVIGEQFLHFLEERLIIGLARSSPSVIESFEHMAIIAHHGELPNFERLFRELGEEYNQYFRRMALFQGERLLSRLATLYLMAKQLIEADTITKLMDIAGEFKSSYYEVPPLHLVGVGERTFYSKSGYEGDVLYFLELDKKEWYTYTNVRPTFYDTVRHSGRDKGKESAPWEMNCSMEELGEAEFILNNAKINNQHRLSSGGRSKGTILGKMQLEQYDLGSIWYEDFLVLADACFDQQTSSELQRLVFIRAERMAASVFDNINQTYQLPLYDKNNRCLDIQVYFTKEEKYVIRELERLEKRLRRVEIGKPPLFLGITSMVEGKMKLYPIAFYDL